VRALSGPPHGGTGISLEAVKLLKAYQRLDIEAIATLRLAPDVERETEAALREFVRSRSSATPAPWPSSMRSAAPRLRADGARRAA
jgi:hypothetical protein